MIRRPSSPTSKAWWLAGLLIPLVVIGGLLGILADSENGLERVPVALVNNDELLTEVDDSGEETFFIASRPLVLELVGSDDVRVDWVVTDAETADALLASGDVYAVVEIPENFSEAVRTLESSSPETTQFVIRTNPSHSYLSGVLAEQVGTGLQAALGDQFSREIVKGLYTVIIDLGDALVQASDAANELSDGVGELADGVGDLRTGTRDLADGYAEFDDGLQQYADGVGQLADGLDTFATESAQLDELSGGVTAYTDGVSQVSTGLSQLAPTLSGNPFEQQLLALIGGLAQLAGSGPALSSGVAEALDGVQDGLRQSANGAEELADASADLLDGSAEIRTGTSELADGVDELSDGVEELRGGVNEFAEGLREGADQFREEGLTEPSETTLDALVNPVTFESEVQGGEIDLRESVASLIIPVGLWISSLSLFLTVPALRPRTLVRTLPSVTLLVRLLLPQAGIALTQAAVATTLLHTLGGMQWSGVGMSFLLNVLGALAIMIVHFVVWTWKPSWLVPLSLGALVIQVATLGTLLPREILPAAYQALSGWGPVAALADGLHALGAEGDPGRIIAAAIGLGLSVLFSLLLAAWTIHRTRETVVARYMVPEGTASH